MKIQKEEGYTNYKKKYQIKQTENISLHAYSQSTVMELEYIKKRIGAIIFLSKDGITLNNSEQLFKY